MKPARFSLLYLAIFGIIVLSLFGCPSGGNNDKSLRVRVVDNSNTNYTSVPNATVVLGDSNGAMVTYGTTDANGELTFSNPPANATVTAATSCMPASGHWDYEIYTMYDVNSSAVLVSGCNTLSPLGIIKLVVTNPTTSYPNNKILVGGSDNDYSYYMYVYGGLSSAQTFTVYSTDIQSDGELSIVVLGQDSNYRTGVYGAALDLSFVSGMTVTVAVDQPVSKIQYNITSVPDTVTSIFNQISMYRKDQTVSLSDRYVTSSATSTIVDMAYVPGFSTNQWYFASISLDRDGNGSDDAFLSSGTSQVSEAPSNQNFDFSQMPVIPDSLAVSYATGTARPTFSWNGADGNAMISTGQAFAANSYSWIFSFVAPPTRTSIIFPELPDTLAAFRPVGITWYETGNYVSSFFTGV